jgi:gas vesicle protein
MPVVRPVLVGLLLGAALAFVVALLRPRSRTGYQASALKTAGPVAES